jgi:cell division protein FtsI (penicillin-binding protein 3)
MLILAHLQKSDVRPQAARLDPPVGALPEPHAADQVRLVGGALAAMFLAVGGQLASLAWKADAVVPTAAMIDPVATSFSRPDIVDRSGRLLATDVEVHSLYADPARVQDADEAVEKLAALLPGLDEAELRKSLADSTKRFAWVRRGLTPKVAQTVHDLGLPGFGFRKELRRAYPLGALAGHVLGRVDADNKGIAGVESYIDEHVGIDAVHATRPSDRAPVRLSIDMAVQAGLEAELSDAMTLRDRRGRRRADGRHYGRDCRGCFPASRGTGARRRRHRSGQARPPAKRNL